MDSTNKPSRYGEVLRFAIPVSLEVLLQTSLGLVDQLFVASLGEPSFVAAGLTGQLVTTVFVVLAALGMGGAVQLARHAGARAEAEFSSTAAQLMQVAALLGVTLALGLMAWPAILFELMGAEPVVVERGVFFMRLVGWSLPLMGLTEAGNHVLRARGEVRGPMVIGVVALVLNTALNCILIFGWLGFPAMGLAGAAVATLLARGVALGLVCWRLTARDSSLAVHLRDLGRFDGQRLASLLRLALPIAAGQGVWVLGMMGYTRVYAALGTSGLAAANAVGALEGLWLTFSFGFGAACMTLVGHELGRKDEEAAQALAADVMRLSGGVALFTGALLALCSLWVDTFYPRLTESTLALTAVGMVAAGMMQPLKTLNMVLANGVLRSGGDLRFVLGCEFLLPIGILSAYVLGVWLGFGLLGALAGKACEEALKLGAHLWRYRSRRWIHELT